MAAYSGHHSFTICVCSLLLFLKGAQHVQGHSDIQREANSFPDPSPILYQCLGIEWAWISIMDKTPRKEKNLWIFVILLMALLLDITSGNVVDNQLAYGL